MTREEKIKLAIDKGFTYDSNTGKIFGVRGKEIKRTINGYICFQVYNGNKPYILYGHQLAYFIKYNKIVDYIDHINGNKSDNRICNLREVTHQQNQHNNLHTNTKGFTYNKRSNRYRSYIKLNNKQISLGCYDTQEEAHQVYLKAKKIYHII